MIKKLKLKFGPQPNSEPLSFDPGAVTVFVGPNNSGKSMLLREIERYCQQGPDSPRFVLDSVSYPEFSLADLESAVEEMKMKDAKHPVDGNIKYGRFNSSRGFIHAMGNPKSLENWSRTHSKNFAIQFVTFFVSRFGGRERFHLVDDKPAESIQSPPTHCLSKLLRDNLKRKKVRDLVHEAFGRFFVVDPTSLNNLQIRLSAVAPENEMVERSFTDAASQFFAEAQHIRECSDGVQAFTGLVMTVVAGEEKIMLIDEPEAFLHPALANTLGKRLSELMAEREGNLLVSTHSPSFVMGCLQSGKGLNIVRLTHDQSNKQSTARLLTSEKVTELFKDPLLRSTGVMQALFHQAVIVTEADSDRAFYSEMNERISDEAGSSLAGALFLNAREKSTIWTIVRPLRQMGIPAAGIVDIDFVKDAGQLFTRALEAANVPQNLHQHYQDMRANLKRELLASGQDMKKDGGVNILSEDKRGLAHKFIADMAEYGIFVVPGGELESWLSSLGISGHGPKWLVEVLGKIGVDPSDSSYLTPSEGDVWDFMRSISSWVKNPQRRGMP